MKAVRAKISPEFIRAHTGSTLATTVRVNTRAALLDIAAGIDHSAMATCPCDRIDRRGGKAVKDYTFRGERAPNVQGSPACTPKCAGRADSLDIGSRPPVIADPSATRATVCARSLPMVGGFAMKCAHFRKRDIHLVNDRFRSRHVRQILVDGA
jgi:hypothetical protein